MISKNELKFIRSLKNKKYRVSEKRFLVEGSKNVLELMSSDFDVKTILVTKDFFEEHEALFKDHHVEVVSKKVLTEVSSLKTNEKVLAVAHTKEYSVADLDSSRVLFALDGVNDPGNLGTIIRTLDWFGIDQLVCSEDSVEFYNPKVISATMGSFARIKVIYTDLPKFLESEERPKVGADMNGTNLLDWKPSTNEIVVMGSESHGIRDEIKPHLNGLISISGKGEAESLNVGVATGIIAGKLVGSV